MRSFFSYQESNSGRKVEVTLQPAEEISTEIFAGMLWAFLMFSVSANKASSLVINLLELH